MSASRAPKTPLAQIVSKEQDTSISPASADTESELFAPSQSGAPKRGRLIAVACDSCRKKKIKCDGKRPNCGNCRRKSGACEYQLPQAERLKATKARLKDAENEIDILKTSMARQASNDITHTFDEIELANAHSSTVSPNLQTQRLFPASFGGTFTSRPLQENTEVLKDIVETGWLLPTSTRFSAMLDIPGYQSYHQSNSSHTNQHGGLQTFPEDPKNTIKTPLWQILPMNSIGDNQTVEPCLLHYLDCRKSLAAGVSADNVLGPDILDLSCLMTPDQDVVVHPFTSWIISYIDVFAGPALDWFVKLASIYCMWHFFRWLVYPTEENFTRMPEFMRPTGLQLCVPHAFWINFVIEPGARDEFVAHPRNDDLHRWKSLYLTSNIRWSPSKPSSPIVFHQLTNTFHLNSEFETTVRSLKNWYQKQT